ncbi:PKD domain-containing protein [Pseudoalteromonas sp.]|uniref:PKD domain-containing protein n=1 Tax=Pseudoalteromonas sp. TaxID=53249 RepID=UPI003D0BABFF
MLIQKRLLAAVFGTLFLVGCGGGGSSDSGTKPDPVDPVNQSPTVSISADSEGTEQTSFKLSAVAGDSDGSIASYSWTSDASFDFAQSGGLTSAEATFQTPDIDADTTVNFTVTVTDNDGATASAKHSVIFKRNVSTVTITGIVTDQPIANAELEINVGSDVFSVNADPTGRYTIELVVDESASEKLVLVKAKGLDSTNPGVVFVSQLSSIQALLEQAGEDNTLDSEDNFGVNITNVTTAEYALLTRNNEEPQSVEELNAALLNVDADEKILLATLIKIIVDNADYVLPEGVENTLDLVSDEDTAKSFEDEVNEKDPDLIEETKEEIKKDENLVSDSDEPIVGDFIVNSPRYYNNDAYHLVLASDGTGELNANTSSTLTMSKESGVYTLALANSVVTYTDEYNDGNESYIAQTKLTDISFQVLAENEVFRTIEVTQTTQRTLDYQNGSEPVVEPSSTRTYTTNLIDKTKTIALNTAELTENTWILDLRDNDYDSASSDDEPETLRFYADGTGDVTGESSEVFSWVLNDTKLSISYDENGETGLIEFWFTKALSAGYQVVALDTSFDEPSNTLTGLMIKKANVTTTDEDIIGRWHGFVGTSQSYDLNIYPDGSVAIGLGYSSFQGHIEDGNFSRKRFYSETYGLVSSCDGFADDCYLESEMQHEFINIVGSTYYIIRTLTYYTMAGEAYDEVKSVFIYEYSKDLSYSAFTEELLEGSILFYKDDSSSDAIYMQYNDLGEVEYVVSFDGVEHIATFNDGVLSYQVDGNTWFVELVSADENAVTICRYQQGSSCSADTQISYLPKRPKVTLTVNPSQNGNLSPTSQTSYWYQYASFVISPDEGYVIDEITGCEGYIEGGYYLVYTTGADCDITATFKPALLASGEYILNNSDLYNAPALGLLLNADNTGAVTLNGSSNINWYEVDDHIELSPIDSIVVEEYISFPDGMTEVQYRTEISNAELMPMAEKGLNWHWLTVEYSYYENDVLVNTSSESSNVYAFADGDEIAVASDDVVGQWAVSAEQGGVLLNMQINADGTGSYIDILNDEQDTFSWQIIDSNLVLNHNSDNSTDTLYFTKNINVGYQFLDQGNDSEGDYVDAGMFVKRNEVAINTGNFSGRHRFREGHEIDSHWSEIQIYDDGEIFFTFSTSSFQGSFVNNRYIRRLYVDTSSGGWETTDFCDTSLDTCFLYGEFVYKLIAIDGARYFVERTVAFDDNGTGVLEKFSANLYVHDYASSTAVDKFYDYNLYSFTLYESDGTTWSLSEQDYNEDSQSYDYSLTIGDQSITGVQLVDGKLSFIENGQDTLLELISNNRTELVFCKYLAGNSCQSQDQVSLSMSN